VRDNGKSNLPRFLALQTVKMTDKTQESVVVHERPLITVCNGVFLFQCQLLPKSNMPNLFPDLDNFYHLIKDTEKLLLRPKTA